MPDAHWGCCSYDHKRVRTIVCPAAGGENGAPNLMLREGHVWAPKEVTVPISEVDRIAKKIVHLKMSRADVEALSAVSVRRG